MKLKLITTTLLLSATMAVSAFAGLNINIDGIPLATDAPPVIVDGRTLVPVRAIFEKLGASVNWDANTQTVTAVTGEKTITLKLNDTSSYVNNELKTLDVPAQIVDGRTMVPARFVGESLGCQVLWDANTQTVNVNTVSQPTTTTPTETTPVKTTPVKTTPVETVPKQPQTQTVKKTGVYVGSLESDKYHRPTCRWAKKITQANLIGFDSKSEAISKGYSPCGTCKP